MSSLSNPSDYTEMKPLAFSQQSWWSRQSRRRRLLFLAALLIIAIALAVGLGVGLTAGDDSDSSDSASSQPNATASPTTPNPPTNATRTLWRPSINATWQIVLKEPLALPTAASPISPSVSIFDIDLFTNNASIIATLHGLQKRVICYFSAGSYEPDRPDSSSFQPGDMGKELDGWPGEKWLDIRISNANVRDIMKKRIQLASEKGCDAIDPDNVDGYQNDNGLDLTKQDSVDFMTFLSAEASSYNMSIGLKNAGDIIPDVLNITHFSVNEQCVQYDECDTFAQFVTAGKPVFHIEYPDGAPKVEEKVVSKDCGQVAEGFSTVLKKIDLDGWVEYCDGNTATTAVNSS